MADRTIIQAAQPGTVERPVGRFGLPEYVVSSEASALVQAARARGLTTQEAADAMGCTPLEWTQLKRGEKTLDAASWAAGLARINAAQRGTRNEPRPEVLALSDGEAQAFMDQLATRLGR